MNPRTKALKAAASRRLQEARRIAKSAEAEGRNLTPEEKTVVEKALEVATAYKAEIKSIEDVEGKTARIDELLGTPPGPNGGGALFAAFKSAGWEPGKRASVPFAHLKEAGFSGDLDELNPRRRDGAELGFDRRWLHDSFPREAVDGTTTSVKILRQSGRTLASVSDMRRSISETSEKPETASVKELIDLALEQIASVESGTPNIILASSGFASMVETDLRLAYLRALDAVVAEEAYAAATAGPTPGDILENIRRAITIIQEDGYTPDTVALNPVDAEAMDLHRSSGPEEFYTFGAGNFASAPFRMRVAISPAVTDPLVFDASAAGRLYVSPVSLATFEENAGKTNTSTVRLEGNGAFGVERDEAIVAIGA